MELMAFLEPYIKEASTDSNMDTEHPLEDDAGSVDHDASSQAWQDSRNDDDVQSSRNQSPCSSVSETPRSSLFRDGGTFRSPSESQRPKKKKKKSTESMSEFESSFLEVAKAQASRLDTPNTEQPRRDAIDAFFESCSLRAKQLPTNKQLWLQMQVSMLLYTSETSENLRSFMPPMAYPPQPQQVYPQQQAYPQQVPVPGNTYQQLVPLLPRNAYQLNRDSENVDVSESNIQITQSSGLDILSMAMSSLQ